MRTPATSRFAAQLPWLLCLAWLLCCLATALAGPLADPTRPPEAAPAVAPARVARRAGTHHDARTPVPAPAAAEPLQLQSVQLPSQGTPSALVDGRLVQPGDRLGELTVVAIDAQGLLLRSPRGTSERLNLLSGVLKHASGTAPGPASAQAYRHTNATPPGAAAPETPSTLAVAGSKRP